MKTKASQCLTLAEYREQVLRISQRDLAMLARCKQAWISTIERGHLPRPKNWVRLLKAYSLEGPAGELEFERMILHAQQLAALQRPMAEDMPLFALYATPHKPQVTELDRPGKAVGS